MSKSRFPSQSRFGRRVSLLTVLVAVVTLATVAGSNAPAASAQGSVKTQVAMVLDGSLSVPSSSWEIMLEGLADAVENPDYVPQDGSVELAVIQFGGWTARAELEIGPVVVDSSNASPPGNSALGNQIRAIPQMSGYTPLACAIRLAADVLRDDNDPPVYHDAAWSFDPSVKQALNWVTDGNPNRCCNDDDDPYESDSCPDGTDAYDSAEAARNHALTTLQMAEDQDELNAEAVGVTPDLDWLRERIVWPQPGYDTWPPPGPGWVRQVESYTEFAETISEKFEIILYGSVTAHKFNDLNGDGEQDGSEDDLQDWSVTLYGGFGCTGTGVESKDTDGGGNATFTGLEEGDYSVQETLKEGWTNITGLCKDVTLPAGGSATLEFGNQELGRIVVDKVTQPSGSTQSFPFTTGGTGYGTFSLTDGADPNNQELVPGSYSLTEDLTGLPWDLAHLTCVSLLGTSAHTVSIPTVDIDLAAGDTVTCTVTNTLKSGDLAVAKVVDWGQGVPDASKQFTICVEGPTYPSGDCQVAGYDGGVLAWDPVDSGVYTVTEESPGGEWTVEIGDARVSVEPGGSASTTVTNTLLGQIMVKKETVPPGSDQAFTFDPSWSTSDFDLRGGESEASGSLEPGTYSVSETAAGGWTLTSATCSDGSEPSSIQLAFGETVTCTFTNTERGRIVVEKQTRPDGDPTEFDFNGEIEQFLSDDDSVSKEVEPGTYTVSETVPLGWDLMVIVCDDEDSTGEGDTATYDVDPGETVTCVFRNGALPELAVDKRLAGFDRGAYYTNYVTFTIVVSNVGPNPIDVLPLEDIYDPYYLSFVDATPYPEEDADDGTLAWYDLTEPAPHGFGVDLVPGEAFSVTALFIVAHDIVTTVNTAVISGAIDIYENIVPDVQDDLMLRDTPTAVELLYFRIADVTGRDVELAWATAVELDTLGFNLYRAPQRDWSEARLVASVSSRGRGVGGAYTHVDSVPGEGLWWYWLGKIRSAGDETLYGPVSSAVGVSAWPGRAYLPVVLRR